MRQMLILVCAATVLGGCPKEADPPRGTRGTTRDASVMMSADAGATETDDAGMATTDAGSPSDASALDAGSPSDAGRTEPFGGPCETGDDCESGICATAPSGNFCTRICNFDLPNACRAEQRFCLPVGDGRAACAGPMIQTGFDTDDANLQLGDCVSRTLSPLGTDADLFQIRAAIDRPIEVTVSPGAGVDVEALFYDGAGTLIARQNMGGAGEREALGFSRWSSDGVLFVLVTDAGSTIANPFEICVRESAGG